MQVILLLCSLTTQFCLLKLMLFLPLCCIFYFCLLENLVKSVDRESLMFSISIFPAKKELFEITQNILCKFCMLVTIAGNFKLTEIDFNSLLLCWVNSIYIALKLYSLLCDKAFVFKHQNINVCGTDFFLQKNTKNPVELNFGSWGLST